jgi:hypothetical protein
MKSYRTYVTGICPKGKAALNSFSLISQISTLSDKPIECSSLGICNRITGTCDCFPPFAGVACERCNLESILIP